jgi:hypothetical protein
MEAKSVTFRSHILLLVVGLAGCGGGERTSPVEGDVSLDGKPVAGAAIQFVPQEKGRDATAETDKDGHFVMSTFQPRDGVVAGSYKVVITPPVGSADTAKYGTAEEAMSAAAKQPTKKEASAFPQKYTRPDQTPLTQDVPVSGKVKFELKSQ